MVYDDQKIGRVLVSDELFDLSLYKALKPIAPPHLQSMLDELIPVETRHYNFWQDFYKIKIDRLDPGRRVKLGVMISLCRIFGEPAIHLILEAIEVYGIRKYLTLWHRYQKTPLADAVRPVLQDEFEHEDKIVTGYEQKQVDPERIRNIFLGFNDGLVEFVGAVGGFFAAFQDARSVLIASATAAVAGALSMSVGVYASSSSEEEMQQTALDKKRFLSGAAHPTQITANPFVSGVIVGVFYLFGALVPILPVVFGAKNVIVSWLCGGIALVLVTAVLSLISGMQIRKRVLMNLTMVSAAVGIAYAIGILVKKFLGI